MFTDKKHPEIIKAVKKICYGIGEESIELENGGIIEFTARSRQAARGYDGISLVVYDETQELTDEQAEAIMAVLSASATGTRQLIYIGTPPYICCTGEVFRRFRQACIVAAGRGGVWAFKDSIVKPTAQSVITAANMLVNDLREHAITWYSRQDELRDSSITDTKCPISGGWGVGGQTSAPI